MNPLKRLILLLLAALVMFVGCRTKAKNDILSNYKGLPLIKATSIQADYRIGNDWTKGSWNISPQIQFDSLSINCYSDNETFAFYTDIDSIVFDISPNKTREFYVLLNDTAYALTIVKGKLPCFGALKFDTTSKDNSIGFWYEQNENNEYLKLLRTKFPADSLTKGTKTDTERILKILNWVHKQWQHNGNNQPKKTDAISILEEVREGKNFRCVEYGIVTTACLNAVGLKARTLALKTKDVETRQSGAGHVLLEVFLNDLKKWVLLDAQWDAMPVLNGVPLNAVEFQKAISEDYKNLEIRTSSDLSKRHYIEWIYPYLYYFDIAFDNREGIGLNYHLINGKKSLMLVPLGAKEPKVFQTRNEMDYFVYTNSLNDFYEEPK